MSCLVSRLFVLVQIDLCLDPFSGRDKGCLIATAALSCLGVFIGRSVWLLQDLDVSFAVTVFFFAGKLIVEKRIVERISSKPIYPAACMLLGGYVT